MEHNLNTNHTAVAAGNVIGDAQPDLIVSLNSITGPDDEVGGKSYLFSGSNLWAPVSGSLTANSTITGPTIVVPVGNVDNVGGNDIGLVNYSPFNRIGATTELNYHLTGGVSFSTTSAGNLVNDLSSDVAFDTATPFFESLFSSNVFGDVSALALDAISLRAVGNANQADGSDLVMVDVNGHSLAFYAGRELTSLPVNPTGTSKPTKLASFAMAVPLNEQTVIRSTSSLDLQQSSSALNVAEALTISGSASGGQLSAPRSVGDINGDAIADFAWETPGNIFFTYGPLDIQSNESITSTADLVIERFNGTPFANLVSGTGRVLPSSSPQDSLHDDLLFYRLSSLDATRNTLELSAVRGGQTLPRDLDRVRSLGTVGDQVRYKTTSMTVSASSNVSVVAIDWTRDGTADLAVFEGTLFSNSVLTILDGNGLAAGSVVPVYSTTLFGATSITNVGDFTGDGWDDLLVVGRSANPGEFVLPWRAQLITGGVPLQGTIAQGTAITAATNDISQPPAVYPLGDIGNWNGNTSNGRRDGYDDLAIFDPTANMISVIGGGFNGLVVRSTVLGGAVSSNVTLRATAGDFDADGLGDLAIVQSRTSTNGNSSQSSDGSAFVFSNLAASAPQLTLAGATRVITSNSVTGVIDSLSTTPFVDFNGDKISDLLLGARLADVSGSSGVLIDAGRTFAVAGSAKRGTASSSALSLSNIPVSGSGDYLVDRANGQPARFPEQFSTSTPDNRYVLTPSNPSRDYRIDTLGDGLPGNSISVSSLNVPSVSLTPITRAQTTLGVTGESITSSNVSPLAVGPTAGPPTFGYVDYDISSLLPYRDNLDALQNASLDFDYSASSLNVPSNPGGDTPQYQASMGGRYFTVMGGFSNKRLFATDGTVAGTTPITLGTDGTTNYFLQNVNTLKSFEGEIYFFSNLFTSPGTNLWKLSGSSNIATLVARDIQNISQLNLVRFGSDILLHTGNGAQILRLDSSSPTGTTVFEPTSNINVAWLRSISAATGAVTADTLLFTDNQSSLRALSVGQSTSGIVANNVFASEGTKLVVVPANGNAAGAVYLNINRPSGALSRVSLQPGALGLQAITLPGPTSSIYFVGAMEGINGRLVFWTNNSDGNGLYAVDSASTEATLVTQLDVRTSISSDFTPANFSSGAQLLYTMFDNGQMVLMSTDGINRPNTIADLTALNSADGGGSDGYYPFAPGAMLDGKYYFTALQKLFVTDGSEDGTSVLKTLSDGSRFTVSPSTTLLVAGDQLYIPAHRGTVTYNETVLLTLGGNPREIKQLGSEISVPLKVGLLTTEGDGVISDDRFDSVWGDASLTVTKVGGRAQVNVVAILREALRRGLSHITLKLSVDSPTTLLRIDDPQFSTSKGIRLNVTAPPSPTIDVFDAAGRQLAVNQRIVDMRGFPAGQYTIRVHAEDLTTTLPFQLEINAPAAGQTLALYGQPDRDRLDGGDGDDTLSGNSDYDRLVGGNGRDQFIADTISSSGVTPAVTVSGPEVRDYVPGTDYTIAGTIDPAQLLPSSAPLAIDPVINTGVATEALASILGIPLTPSGKLARQIRASDLASIQTLDFSHFSERYDLELISAADGAGLSFLSHMTNLRSLNLSGNAKITSLGMLTPRIDFTTGAQLGTAQLRHLAINDTGVTSLASIVGLSNLHSLSADRLAGGSQGIDFSNMRQLSMLSIDNSSVTLPAARGQWNAEGNYIDSISNLAATPLGGINITASGQVGSAFQFNGIDAAVDLGNRTELNLQGSMTVAMWIKFDRLNGGQYFFADFNLFGDRSQGAFGQSGNTLVWYQTTDFGFFPSDPNNGILSGTTSLQTNRWYFVSVVRDDAAKTVSMYLDGKLESSRTYYGNVIPVQQTRLLGRAPGFFGTSFQGALDQVMIFDQALSTTQLNLLRQPTQTLAPDSYASLASLPSLQAVSLRNQGVTSVTPLLRSDASMTVINLDGNSVRELGPLLGSPMNSQPAVSSIWTSNIHPTSDAVDGDYAWVDGRISPTGASNAALWSFFSLLPGDYEIQATWLPGSDRATNATYSYATSTTAYGTEGPVLPLASVNQRLTPALPSDGTSRWQSLGTVRVSPGTYRLDVLLSQIGDGIITADAIKLVRTTRMLPALSELSLLDNPLSNDSRDRVMPQLVSLIEKPNTAANEVRFAADSATPVFEPIPTIVLQGESRNIPLVATDANSNEVRFSLTGLDSNAYTLEGDLLTIDSSQMPAGVYHVTVTAVDVSNGIELGRTATQTFDVVRQPDATGQQTTAVVYGRQYGNNSDQHLEGWKITLDVGNGTTYTTLTDRNGEFVFFRPVNLAQPTWTLSSESRDGWVPSGSFSFNPIIGNLPGDDSVGYVTVHDFSGPEIISIITSVPLTSPVPEGQAVLFTGNAVPFYFPNPSYSWSVNGVAASNQSTLNFTPPNEGRYLVSLTVAVEVANQTLSRTVTRELFATNVAPSSVSGQVIGTLVEGGSVVLNASATDIDGLVFQWDINGDGSYDEGITGNNRVVTWTELTNILSAARRNGPSTGNIRVRAFDGIDARESAWIPLDLNNAAPVALTGGPYSINEGTELRLSAVNSFDYGDPSNSLTYAWDLNNDGVNDITSSDSQVSIAWSDLAAYGIVDSAAARTIRLQVRDPQNAVGTALTTLTVENVAPNITTSATAGSISEGDTLQMAATWTDVAADTHSVQWSILRQNVTLATFPGPNLQYVVPDNSTFTVRLTVTDDEGGASSKDYIFNSTNTPPTATLVVPPQAIEGQSVTITVTSIVDSADDLAAGHRFDFDFDGDGNYEVTNSAVASSSHTYLDNGQYSVRVRVRDKDDAEVILTQTIVVNNAPPTAALGFLTPNGTSEGATGVTVRFTSPSDPSPEDTAAGFRYSFDLNNDGIFEITDVTQASQTLAIPQDGSYIVRGRIMDRDGGYTESTATLTISNTPPAIGDLQIPATIVEGTDTSFTATVSDPGPDLLQASVRIVRKVPVGQPADNGVVVPAALSGGQLQFSHRFPTDLALGYSIIIVAQDEQTQVTRTFDVAAVNDAPVLTLPTNRTARVGQLWSGQLNFSDRGTDQWQVSVNYGDGTLTSTVSIGNERSLTLNHLFTSAATRTVTVSVNDGTTTTTATFDIAVSTNAAPTVVRPLGSVTVPQATRMRTAIADLNLVFADADALSNELIYQITVNSSPTLASASIENGLLLTELDPAAFGSATITVRATDAAGGTATDQLLLNVIGFDRTAPSSQVAPLPAIPTSLDLPVSVVGSDATVPGSTTSGVVSYDLYVSVDGAAATRFATVPANAPATIYRAQSDHLYFFYSVARDAAGNVEAVPAIADQFIYIGDLETPTSQVESAVANSAGLFNVAVSGRDSGSSSLQRLDVYVSVDGGIADLVGSISAGSPDPTGLYRGNLTYQGRLDSTSHTYRFFSIARDGAGNVEAPPTRDADVLVTATFATQSLQAIGIDVQQGDVQRSYIRSVDILFSSDAGLANLLLLNPIEVYRYELNATDISRQAGVRVTGNSATRVGDRIRLDWGSAGITGNRSTNAGDGLYRVFVDGNADGDFDDAVDSVFEFARILGDANGDAVVNQSDLDIVNSQQGRTGPGLNGDVDGSGAVNITDRQRTTTQQGRNLAANLRTLLDD